MQAYKLPAKLRQYVESEALSYFAYDPLKSILEVGLNSGKAYQYTQFPYWRFVDLCGVTVAGESIGKFYNRYIKGQYDSYNVTDWAEHPVDTKEECTVETVKTWKVLPEGQEKVIAHSNTVGQPISVRVGQDYFRGREILISGMCRVQGSGMDSKIVTSAEVIVLG